MMFIGTFIHNAFHWIILFWAFNINLYFWIATTFAILLHSIPQNIVNYIMNHNNIKYSYYAAFWWVFWALLTLVFYSSLQSAHLFILWLISGSLLYIALTDIMPEFHSKNEVWARFKYLFFIILWIIIFWIYTSLVSML
jgi:zinc and cadmium transporter